jgi:hypothetical protein
VFGVTAGRRGQRDVIVFLASGVLTAWEQAHGRRFSTAEQYAIAKMALFQAFDERPRPELMRADVFVRAADLDAIIETLGIE